MLEFAFDHRANQTPLIWHPEELQEPQDCRIRLVWFRHRFKLAKNVGRARLWITASHRYELFVDGVLVDRGPSRGDPLRWNCRQVALGKLPAGGHELLVRVAHFGAHSGVGQMGEEPFLLVAGIGGLADIRSEAGWSCWSDRSRTALTTHRWGDRSPFLAAGCGEDIDGTIEHLDPRRDPEAIEWIPAIERSALLADPWGHLPLGYRIRPDALPAMRETQVAFSRCVEAPEDLQEAAQAWVADGIPLEVPAKRHLRVVVDRGEITNAFPRLRATGGHKAVCELTWVEAARAENGDKGNRDETDGKCFYGHGDRIRWAGVGTAERPEIRGPLHFRSFRYLAIDIRTGKEPLTLLPVELTTTTYPMQLRASFTAAGPEQQRFQTFEQVSWRTLQLCAQETFFDCPHYEQCQFPGDTRIQALAHYLVADDDRLVRKAIDDFHASRLADGMLLCKHPSTHKQVLPTYAIAWLGMLHDFRVYRGDADFLAPYLPAAREVIDWFWRRRREDGLLGHIPHACFLDWTKGFARGNAPQDADGGSSILTLQLREACFWLAELETTAGYPELRKRWLDQAKELGKAVKTHCYDKDRRLLRDTASGTSYSQHAQIQAVLADLWPRKRSLGLLRRAAQSSDLIAPGTLYYRFFLIQAWKRVDDQQAVLDSLHNWDRCLVGTGLTTWPESDGRPRSDCHAWSVTPVIEVLQTILGYGPDPASSGFEQAVFAPALGKLPAAQGSIPTPHGTAEVTVSRRSDGGLACQVDSPVPLLTPDRKRPLPAGRHEFDLPPANAH